ncbi:MAG: hypothetical protein PVH57_07695 [Syntrophobacterales bacterium]
MNFCMIASSYLQVFSTCSLSRVTLPEVFGDFNTKKVKTFRYRGGVNGEGLVVTDER